MNPQNPQIVDPNTEHLKSLSGTADHQLVATVATAEAVKNLEAPLEGVLLKTDEGNELLKKIVENTIPKEINLIETNRLLSELTDEVKKKESDEEITYSISDADRVKLRGDIGPPGEPGTAIEPAEIIRKLKTLSEGDRLDYEWLDNKPDFQDRMLRIARTVISSKTVSLKELDDVNLTGLTITNGKYNLGSGGGVGGSQTPWTSDINGAGFGLSNVSKIRSLDFDDIGSATYTYNANETLHTKTINGRVITYSYNADGSLDTKNDTINNWKFNYSGGLLSTKVVT